jgi:hypothetical protein
MMSAWQRCIQVLCLRGQLEDTVIIKEVHALHILEYNNLCNHLKDDDDVTRSTISYQGKNTPCQTFIMDGLRLYYIKLFLHLTTVY